MDINTNYLHKEQESAYASWKVQNTKSWESCRKECQ